MCKCIDVAIGSYGNQVELKTPAHMKELGQIECYEFRDTICVDRCIAEEVQGLWARGITTTGCCCGHNVTNGYIGVVDSDIDRMIVLGYKGIGANFLPKSLE